MSAQTIPRIPPLQPGDHLSVAEFLRRYQAMPEVKKAELIDGVVYLPSPVSHKGHGGPHFDLIGWLGFFCAYTSGVVGCDNTTLRLELGLNMPQPDAFLRILPEYGGQTRSGSDGYLVGGPELIGEVAASSASYDLHVKLTAYQRNRVQEYVVWRVLDRAIDWFVLRGGKFKPLAVGKNGLLQSEVFPGLWLEAKALIRGDLARVLHVVQKGLASKEHRKYVASLKKWKKEHS